MAKEVIIDPDWEEREQAQMTRPAPRRVRIPAEDDPFGGEDSGVIDPFGVDSRGPVPHRTGRDRPAHTPEPDEDDHFDEPEADEPPFDPDPVDETPGAPPRSQTPAPPPAAAEDPFTAPDDDIPASKAKEYIGMLLSGGILARAEVRKVYPYLLMLAFLMLLYISSLFRMQQLHRREIELTRQVKELRATALEMASRRMKSTRQSFIIEELGRRGIPLMEALEPPKIVEK